MSTIRITRSHPFTIDEAKSRLAPLSQRMESQLGLDVKWDENTLLFKGRGADGKIVLTESEVDVTLALGLLLSPLKSKLEEKIHHGLDEAIQKS